MRIYLLGNAQREGVTAEAERLLPFLRQQCCEIVVYDLLREQDLSRYPRDEADGSVAGTPSPSPQAEGVAEGGF